MLHLILDFVLYEAFGGFWLIFCVLHMQSDSNIFLPYFQANATVYTDETIGSVTGQKYLEHVAYVDKHTQVRGVYCCLWYFICIFFF